MVSISRRFTGRKLLVAFLAMLGVCIILAKSYDTLVDRFVNAPKESEESRVHFEEAASAMLAEHPAGVGMNLFSHMLETQYSPRFEIAQVDQSGLVHNIYWLTAAELGYLGIISYVLYIASPLLLALFYGRFAGLSLFGDLSLGAAVGLGVFFLQGTLEWASRQTALSYLIVSVFSLIPTFARELRRSPSSRSSHFENI